ncbi:MAG: glycosyltransferase family 4 protein [Bacteriovoracaceae bacterium]
MNQSDELKSEGKRRVLYVSPNGYLGGAERFVLNACLGHLKYGEYKPHILFFNSGEFVEIAKEHGIEVSVLPFPFKLTSIKSLGKLRLFLMSFFKAHDFTVINNTMPYSQIAMSLGGSTGIPKVWFQHGPVGGTLDKLATATSFDALFFNTQYLKNLHHQFLNLRKPNKFERIVHYGIPFEEHEEQRILSLREQLIEGRDYLMITAGRICSWKGYHLTIRALNNLYEKDKEIVKKCKLIIVGEAKRESDILYLEQLKSESKNLVDDGIIEFHPFTNELSLYFAASDLFIHSSTTPEPFGLVVAEAMIQGCLVVGGAAGGVREVLNSKKTGFIFHSHQEGAEVELENILKEILEKHSQNNNFEELRTSGERKIRNEFSIEKMTKNLEESYTELCKK